MIDEIINKIIEMFKVLIERKFYGSLTFKFEAGKIVHMVKEESLKI